MTPTKILEIKTTDWMKGLSIQSGLSLGGLFQSAYNFDPFDTMGYLRASLTPVQIDGTTITTQAKHLVSVPSGAEGYVFALGDRGGTGEKCLYRIKMSDSTVADYSTQIDNNLATGPVVHRGITFYKNRIVYEQEGTIRSNLITPAAASDVSLLSSNTGGTVPVRFSIGIDGYLYFTAPETGYTAIGRIISVTDTTNNTTSAFQFIDTNMIPKDITSDGTYTVFIADNNPSRSTLATSTCKVYFWDRIKQYVAEQIYDIQESYLISCRCIGNNVLILGSKGLWICNSVTPPKLIFPMSSTMLPTSADQIDVKENILYWLNSTNQMYAYGSKIGKSIVFSPYQTTSSDNLNVALCVSGNYFIASLDAGTNVPKIYLHNSGTTRNNTTALTTITPLIQPHSLSYIKVVLKAPLSAGQEINTSLYNGNGDVISDVVSKTFASLGAKKTFKVEVSPTASSVKEFEDIYVSINVVGGAIVQRVAVYGVPISDDSQNI